MSARMHREITAYVNDGDTRKIADHLITLCEQAGMRRVEPMPLDPGYRLTPSDYWAIAILPGKQGWNVIKSLPWNILCEPSNGVGSMRFVDLCTALGAPGFLLDIYDGGPWGNLVAETDGKGNRFLNGFYVALDNALEYYGTPLDTDESFTGLVKFQLFADLPIARRVEQAKLFSQDLCFEIAQEFGGENGHRYWSTGEEGVASWQMIDAAMSFGALAISDAVLLVFEATRPSQARYQLTRTTAAYLRGFAHDFAAQQDYVQAAVWYCKAAELGDAEAAYQMNMLYREGRGVPQDLEHADAWLARARPKINT